MFNDVQDVCHEEGGFYPVQLMDQLREAMTEEFSKVMLLIIFHDSIPMH
jgi:hypothetical protein